MKKAESKFALRLPTKLYNGVKFLAAKNHRSINGELINIISEHLKIKK